MAGVYNLETYPIRHVESRMDSSFFAYFQHCVLVLLSDLYLGPVSYVHVDTKRASFVPRCSKVRVFIDVVDGVDGACNG